MYPELINLAPEARTRTYRRSYFIRLTSVALVLGTILVCVNAALLVPTYQFLSEQLKYKQEELSRLSSTKGSDQAAFEMQLAELTKNAERIRALRKAPSTATMLTDVLQIPHERITFSDFSIVASSDAKTASSMTVTGFAKTRDDLRQYQLALQAAPFVASADIPVGVYAKATDLSFTVSITFTTL